MSTQHNAAHGAVKAELCQKTADRRNWDMETMANEALSIGLAVDWIVSANTLLEDIQEAAKSYPEIGKFFRDKNIPIANADWTACEMGDHISRILSRQHVLIKRMAGGAA
ncbi:hypothetical protein [Diaphorobacter caeni]|uniref:hypothetical protein n=1 Tax=Diaphorobacter caeni TaxID=2784387 RepID=UPI00188FA51C|nr:hypothetical protein [Diaphorobacter caeni]MBF5004770.1 hypothetical protein [Diaphorobacter caeni]